MDISIRDRRKIIKVISGVLTLAIAVMLMLNTIPASASGTGTMTKIGSYSKLTVKASATSSADMSASSRTINTGSAKRYVTVSVKTYKGGTLKEKGTNSGNVAAGSSLSSPSKSCPQTYTIKGTSTIYGGTSSSATALETLNAEID